MGRKKGERGWEKRVKEEEGRKIKDKWRMECKYLEICMGRKGEDV